MLNFEKYKILKDNGVLVKDTKIIKSKQKGQSGLKCDK